MTKQSEEHQRLTKRLHELLKHRRIFSKAGRGRMDMQSDIANEVQEIELRLAELEDVESEDAPIT
jgi:hypothetical protein